MDEVSRQRLSHPEMAAGLAATAKEQQLGERVPSTADSSIGGSVGQCSQHSRSSIETELSPEQSFGYGSKLPIKGSGGAKRPQVPLDCLEDEEKYALVEDSGVVGLGTLRRGGGFESLLLVGLGVHFFTPFLK